MSKIHILPDKNLGGVLREYVKVDMDAKKGYFVLVNDKRLEDFSIVKSTDIVHINDTRYRMINRKAKVGDKVIVVKACFNGKFYKNGDILVVCRVRPNGIFVNVGYEDYVALIHSEYYVLEPLDSTQELTTENEGNNKSIIDLLTNIEQRLKSIEQKL